ncbi:flagellar hook protein FlgE [Rhizobium cremeum]|uniref:flagellar hook protein FlgE n=1 Tax=Rhizobium cremeum TaxID=2813827 RepID=UPI000DD69392|nr:flagellar hook protein FlgE [Rhizobium cremeum]MCJ7997946.1 flagellar hook protein FlgE [Rhizobium cremeum]MCJ8003040.1 flagellar hook protein FlgE [Rhizobium cremeum]
MSLFGTMKTAVSGMNAQANRLGTVGDNIANSSTTAYKKASTSFSSLVLPSTSGNYNSGGVETNVSYSVSEQGALEYTTSGTDLAIQGEGFFIVQDTAGNIFLTRAGSFTLNDEGNLVNDAGYILMGYSASSGTPTTVVNSYDGLTPITISDTGLTAVATTSGSLTGNLNYSADIVAAGAYASDNNASVDVDSDSILKTSVTTYDAVGASITYDFYYTKTAAGTWEVAVYNAADANTSGSGSFPYSSAAITTAELVFDGFGKLATVDGTTTFSIDVNGISFDLSGMTQLSAESAISDGSADGSPAEAMTGIEIDSDGTVYGTYAKSDPKALYQVALATVESPDNLTLYSGNVYRTSATSGVVTIGFAGSSGFGEIVAGALETSNVDLASELTEMIEAQRSYSANSKVFQTGSDLMDVLINLAR